MPPVGIVGAELFLIAVEWASGAWSGCEKVVPAGADSDQLVGGAGPGLSPAGQSLARPQKWPLQDLPQAVAPWTPSLQGSVAHGSCPNTGSLPAPAASSPSWAPMSLYWSVLLCLWVGRERDCAHVRRWSLLPSPK